MNSEILQNILYFSLIGGAVFVALLISMQMNIARLKQKNYFLNRDRERYAETLYASQDGYFSFIYPDERIRDPRRGIRERCSRRLAVMLDLKNGIQSSFEDVLAVFYKNDAQKIRENVRLMKEEGLPFEDIFAMKNKGRRIQIAGARINGQDGNLYCDMLWFRDLSEEIRKNQDLESEKQQLKQRVGLLEQILDNLENPIWLRDENLKVVAANRPYMELTAAKSEDGGQPNPEVVGGQTAEKALLANKAQRSPLTLVVNGKACSFEVVETPCRSNENPDKTVTVGMLTDKSELTEVKRNFQIHQTAHLEVLSALGTAFAIFNNQQKLMFYNKAFAQLWNLPPQFLDAMPTYGAFLDEIRNLRLLPEVSDYKFYKTEEEKQFDTLIAAKETLLHIPDGRTFKRMAAPYPSGLIFAYEDVSDRLAATRMINELVSVQQNILNQIRDAVVVFGADQRLKFCNFAYQRLWNVGDVEIQGLLSLDDVLELQKADLSMAALWNDVKQSMMRHILTLHERFIIERTDGVKLEVAPAVLSDDSVMITYICV